MPIAKVALDTPLHRLFDYLAEDVDACDIGRRVRVPFGRREEWGVLVALTEHAEVAPEQLKAIRSVDRDLPPLPAELIDLARFAA
nr:primosomal protein N' [Thiobacillaceae bacterium]